jgi:Domain of unknown function (DUF4291)
MRQIRADYDDSTLTVYQAYSPQIADAALAAGTFVPPFRRERMTWIKPSFFWMMYRCGWATKLGQERVLAVRITRKGFEEALSNACLSHFDSDVFASHEDWRQRLAETSVRVQWDPERGPDLQPLPWRSLQVGLAGTAVSKYVDEWIVGITDMTDRARTLRGIDPVNINYLPQERPYPISRETIKNIGASALG